MPLKKGTSMNIIESIRTNDTKRVKQSLRKTFVSIRLLQDRVKTKDRELEHFRKLG